MISLPKDISDRVDRVLEYHRASKHTRQSVRGIKPQSDPASRPCPTRSFPGKQKISLPTGLLDLPVAALPLLREGLNALPASHVRPPQTLKTIATWLFMADGITADQRYLHHKYSLRTYPSAGALYPCEIYLAAFAIEGLDSGLYSYNPSDFTLTKLRNGPETLAQIKRGRPDLAFLRSVPAALLVSTNFCRSSWKYRIRGFRVALEDAGHLIANLVAVANGLGIQTMTRLKMNDTTMRELIGLPPEHDFGSFEAVQSMIVWADDASIPIETSVPPGPAQALCPFERPPLCADVIPYGSIVATHYDCVAPGIPLRDVKPPLTELSPLYVPYQSQTLAQTRENDVGPSLRQVLLNRRSARGFVRAAISRNQLLAINQAAFATGTFPPIYPNGDYPGLVRAFWLIHSVAGMTPGIWYCHPNTHRWVMVKSGDFREQAATIHLGEPRCADAAALCIMVANLRTLMQVCGPDAYRLAHLEAGIVGQRLSLAAAASGLGSCGVCTFYDDEVKAVLGLQNANWEVLYTVSIGVGVVQMQPSGHPALGIG